MPLRSTEFPMKMEQRSFFYAVLESLRLGLLIFSDDFTLLAANRRMFQYFNQQPRDISGHAFGEVFHCHLAVDSGLSCGQEGGCVDCPLRNTVENVISGGAIVDGILFNQHFKIGDGYQNKWFDIYGSPLKHGNKKYAILSLVESTENRMREMELEQRLELDLATGAKNKYSLIDTLDEAINDLNKNTYVVCMIDFDNFKDINDCHGHLMGDRVLSDFARIVRQYIGIDDAVGRYGGEEFVLLFKNASWDKSLRIVRQIYADLKAAFVHVVDMPVTFSAGMLMLDQKTQGLHRASDLIGHVDKLLYKAKRKGRDRIVTKNGDYTFEP